MMQVAISLLETSQVVRYEAKNTYTKGPFYCVQSVDGKVYKHPLATIWRVTEDYGDSGRTQSDTST